MKILSMPVKHFRLLVLLAACGRCACFGNLEAAETSSGDSRSDDLTELTLDQLMDTPVSTVGRKQQTVSEAAAAVHVISQEDIRRSGATHIAEALRMAPGLNVARIDASRWAVSSRGFNDFFANKLLVLIDGRSVYTPLFSGVFWDVQDTMLEDIDRIEVVRGPGATMWGANAVNGVINIITKKASDTQGGLVSVTGGNELLGSGSVRYGGKLTPDASYRVYVKSFTHDDFSRFDGHDGADEWDMLRAGFRTDWDISPENTLTLQGDVYEGRIGQELTILTPPMFIPPATAIYTRDVRGRADVAGGNVLSSWKHKFSEESDLGLQVYYDRTERNDRVHREIRDTYDIDFQHRFQLPARQEMVWGLGYRYTVDEIGDGKDRTGSIRLNPSRRGDQLFSAFLQDEITLVEDRLRLTLGSKFEHNDYTDFEFQPNGRLLWTPNENHTVWGAVSRAVRTPARFEHTIQAWFLPTDLPPSPLPAPSLLIGNGDYGSEELIAYELGYRLQALTNLSFDLTGFYNEYDDLRSIDRVAMQPGPFPFPATVYYVPENRMEGQTYGAEVAANWKVFSPWRISAGYTWLQMRLRQEPGMSFNSESAEGDSPQNQIHIRSFLDLPYNLQFDTALYYVSNLSNRSAPAYVRLDARLGWRPWQNVDISIGVQNALDDKHREFGEGFLVSPNEIERAYYAKVTWKF